jgi:dienelactone hydrolase
MTRYPFALCALVLFAGRAPAEPLPGTKPLEDKDDLAMKMVAGIDKYLMREIEAATKGGNDRWNVKTDSLQAYLNSVKPNRERLRKLLGVIDERVRPVKMEYVGSDAPSALVAETPGYKVYAVRWPVLSGVDGEGLLLEPVGPVQASVVAIPDADQTPEQIVGLAPGVPAESQFARRLGSTCRVIVPLLIDRKPTSSPGPVLKRDTNIPHREFVWRMAYEMGRHAIGYEVQKVLAAVDWLKSRDKPGEVGVFGYGEGGLVALYAGAIDSRIAATVVSGVGYGTRGQVWREPIDRSVWASLPEFRDEHLRKLFGGRTLVYEHSHSPKFDLPNPPGYRQQAAAGLLTTPDDVRREIGEADAAGRIVLKGEADLDKVAGSDWRTMALPKGEFGHPAVVTRLLVSLNIDTDRQAPEPGKDLRAGFDPVARQTRQFNQLVAFTQRLWRVSDHARKQFLAKADFSSPAAWEKSQERYCNYFWEEVIGKLPPPTEPPNPRSRELFDTPKWKGYEITLDLYPDVFAYGILLLPKDLKEGEKRPVVVCQHGLEGRPTDVCNPKERTKYYNSFAAQLADLGYIVYAPQNPYIGWEKFRVLQRKAHPLKLSLFAFIVRQHETTLDWLSTLPNVDGDRIGFYGLSYGGKTAMRVPAILPKYKLSICSADFNEWVGKNVSVDFHSSYMYTIEYDMYEFNLGQTFNYAEMAYLIAPRPFMVERGHDDGVGVDEMVAYEYAKIRYLYANKLKIPDRTAIEWFAGGHEINGKGTFAFLKQHLGWPR